MTCDDGAMVQRTAKLGKPIDYLASGVWPTGSLEPNAPVAARYARHVSMTLAVRMETESVSDVARRAGIARSTLQRLLAGTSWGDVVTLAGLEDTLGVRLWPVAVAGRTPS